jgi:Flp pilus assembly pilin Flp
MCCFYASGVQKMGRAIRARGNRCGATLIEYAVLGGLIVLALATAIMVAGQRTSRIDAPRPETPPAADQLLLDAD